MAKKMRAKNYSRLGEFLRDVRITKAITQKTATDHLGLSSPQYVSNFERGLCEPSIEHAVRLAEFYGISKRDIYEIMIAAYEEKIKRKIFGQRGSRKGKA